MVKKLDVFITAIINDIQFDEEFAPYDISCKYDDKRQPYWRRHMLKETRNFEIIPKAQGFSGNIRGLGNGRNK